MLRDFLNVWKKSFKQMKQHYKEFRGDIAKNNTILLTSISGAGLLLVTLLLFLTPLIISDWHISMGHWLFLPFFFCYTFLGLYLYKNKRESYDLVHAAVISFLIFFMALVMYINFVPFPDSPATMTTVAMTVVPVLFILPFHEVVLLLLFVFLIFLQLNGTFIDELYVNDNVFSGILGLLGGIFVSWIVSNIRAEDNQDKQDIVIMSNQDKLTGIWNKSAVEKNCFTYLNDCGTENCALIVADLDYFKGINDTMGHHAGDEVLHMFGEAIKRVFRGSDIYGRIGGDEFLVLMKGVSSVELVELKMSTLSAMIHQDVFEKLNIKVTCSYGAIIKKEENISYVPLFNMADKLLYRAKRNGKNQGDVLTISDYNMYMNKKEIMLVVDDSEINRGALSAMFQQDFDIIEAADGEQAEDIIHKHHSIISIMLLDIMMPKVDGFEVLDWMKQQGYMQYFPVIAISSDEEKELQSLELGVADMVSKPFVADIMKKRVENAMKAMGR